MWKSACVFFRVMSVLVAVMFASMAVAGADGSQRIKLLGALAEGQSSSVTITDIEELGVHEFSVYNPFEQREDLYTGVFIKDLAERFGAEGVRTVTTTAIDHYTVDFNKEEWGEFRIIIATRVNGEYIGFDHKGPMRVVFPDYDPKKSIYQEMLPKWMWMITRIEFKE